MGSFAIDDPTTQVNNLGSMAGTTTGNVYSSRSPTVWPSRQISSGLKRVFEGAVVGPSFEMGYQWSNYFDVFYGLSWFTASNSMSRVKCRPGAGQPERQSSIRFRSCLTTLPHGRVLGAFHSSSSVNLGSTPFHNYHLATNSPLRGIYPNRQFTTAARCNDTR